MDNEAIPESERTAEASTKGHATWPPASHYRANAMYPALQLLIATQHCGHAVTKGAPGPLAPRS